MVTTTLSSSLLHLNFSTTVFQLHIYVLSVHDSCWQTPACGHSYSKAGMKCDQELVWIDNYIGLDSISTIKHPIQNLESTLGPVYEPQNYTPPTYYRSLNCSENLHSSPWLQGLQQLSEAGRWFSVWQGSGQLDLLLQHLYSSTQHLRLWSLIRELASFLEWTRDFTVVKTGVWTGEDCTIALV